MATGRSNKLVGQVGEFLVCAELGRRGFIATPFAGNVPGYDVIATCEGGSSVLIQVKANNGIGSWQFSIDRFLDIDFDAKTGKQAIRGRRKLTDPNTIWVFVRLDQSGDRKDRFFILTHHRFQAVVHRLYAAYLSRCGGRRPKRPEALHMAIGLKELEPYEDQWRAIENRLGGRAKALVDET